MQWHLLSTEVLELTDWGWHKNDGNCLKPIMTDKQYAPESLSQIVSCKCKMTTKHPCMTNTCSCRKHRLTCVKACFHCNGEDCDNSSPSNIENDFDGDLHIDEGCADNVQIVFLDEPCDEEGVGPDEF